MTDNANDRRRKPRTGFGSAPGGPARGAHRPGSSSQPPSRPDGQRRGIPPDSGYRPSGSNSGNDPARGRGWGNNQGSRQDNASRRGDYRGPARPGSNPGSGPARSGNNQGFGSDRSGNNQGQRPNSAYQNQRPRSGNSQPGSGNTQGQPAQRGNYPPRQGGSYRPNEGQGDRRRESTNQGRDRYGNPRPAGPNAGRPGASGNSGGYRGGNSGGYGGGGAGGYGGNNPGRPRPAGYRDNNYRDSRPSSHPSSRERQPGRPGEAPAPAPRAAAPPPSPRSGKVDPFELFCAYHLGITADRKFRHANLNDVARRFGIGPGEVKQALQDYGMDAGVVMEKEFDMALAQLDIELAPEGVDRVELARQIYADYLEAPRRQIDWKKIIDEDIRENAKIFGRKD